ncbi:glycosyltransferase [Leptospira sp. GIMC2001]|uniref:glycosyltransferase n=1 Tax=Leptospira sp. GIMC2001 TaxID=1513297 RepID=UPI002348F38F|nr:glycosyltransferase [Leptospira sp. GIMC2001]WCL49233.1 glycosyltransferase [Leptospira sp. GIMC2001]
MILHLNTSHEWRGGENQVLNLAIGLSKRNIQQIIVAQPKSPLALKASEAGIEVIELSMRGEFDISAIWNIRKIISSRKVQIVHTHTAHAHSLAFFAKRKKDNWKLIVARRVDFRMSKNFFSKWKFTSKKIDLVIGVSHQIKKYLIEDGVSPSKVMAIHSGIDISKFKKLPSAEPIRKELKINKKTVTIGIVAALVDHKDHETFLHAIAKIQTNSDFVALILGEGKLEAKLKQLANDLKITSLVQFLGFQDNIYEFYKLFDIFTLTSKEEGLGTSILDAMACGIPVVATRAGGIPEMVIPDDGGFLCDIGDSESLAEKYKLLIEDSALRNRMGEWNRDWVHKFSNDYMVKKTIQVYFSFLGNSLYI